MADARLAIERTLKHEGGYANDLDDPGGETNYGISKRSYHSLDIKNLTREEAIEIYRRDYWVPMWSGIESQDVADCLFDFSVNAGILTAIRQFQKSVGELVAGPLIVDGVFGPATLAATNSVNPMELLRTFTLARLVYYASLSRQKYLKGWFRRALSYWI